MTYARMLLVVTLFVGGTQVADAQQLSKRDRLRIAVQGICPISGQKLGAHGTPIKVQVGKEQIFICCRGCLQNKISPKHWATIHANFAKAQRICPVMKKELPRNPKWTVVAGQIVYVCCPPCTDRIEREPARYLQIVEQNYAASLRSKQLIR